MKKENLGLIPHLLSVQGNKSDGKGTIEYKKGAGFTLVEIMTVMFIVALLVSVAIVEGVKFRKAANESNAQANLKCIATAFEVYAASHGGSYAPGDETDLEFLLDAGYLNIDLTQLKQLGAFSYKITSVDSAGYDIMAIATNPALSNHNYQISNGGILRRSDTASSTDLDFKSF